MIVALALILALYSITVAILKQDDATLGVESSLFIKRPYLDDAGVDLPACIGEPVTIEPKGFKSVPTDVVFDIPEGHYVQVLGRSGLCFKNQILIGAGVIDRGFTGKVGVAMFNMGEKPITIKPGDFIAQAVCIKIATGVEFTKPGSKTTVSSSGRGTKGFGSSG